MPSRDPKSGEYLEKDERVALLLCVFLGGLGIHRFYVGKIGTGIFQMFTLGGFGLWAFVDFCLIITRRFSDSHGRRLKSRRQTVEIPLASSGSLSARSKEPIPIVLMAACTLGVLSVAARLLTFGWVSMILGPVALLLLECHIFAIRFMTDRLNRFRIIDSFAVVLVSVAYFFAALLMPDCGDGESSSVVFSFFRDSAYDYEGWACRFALCGLIVDATWIAIGVLRTIVSRKTECKQ